MGAKQNPVQNCSLGTLEVLEFYLSTLEVQEFRTAAGVPRIMKMVWTSLVWLWTQLPVVEGFEKTHLVVVPDLGCLERFIQIAELQQGSVAQCQLLSTVSC